MALRILLAECVVLLLGTARTHGGRSSRSEARVSGLTRDAREGRAKTGRAEVEAWEDEVMRHVVAELEEGERKIGERARMEAASWRRGWRVAWGRIIAAMVLVCVECDEVGVRGEWEKREKRTGLSSRGQPSQPEREQVQKLSRHVPHTHEINRSQC